MLQLFYMTERKTHPSERGWDKYTLVGVLTSEIRKNSSLSL